MQEVHHFSPEEMKKNASATRLEIIEVTIPISRAEINGTGLTNFQRFTFVLKEEELETYPN